ncbi:MAG TPA: hypothetical protein DCW66_03530 [Sphingobacterium sp.]|nr:hypothetical protein [Sphingobacterium sp.]
MTLTRYMELITAFAIADRDLLHTEEAPAIFDCSADEAAAILQDIGDRMVLLVPPYAKSPKKNNANGNIWLKEGLVVCVQYVPLDNMRMKTEIIDKAESVLDRLYLYFYRLRSVPSVPGQEPFMFDPQIWNGDSIGPIGENHYGYYAELGIRDSIRL